MIAKIIPPLLAAILLAGVAIGTSGCTQTWSTTLSCGRNSGCTVATTYTISGAYSCPAHKDCRKQGGMFEDFMAKVGRWTETIFGIRQAYALVPGFDASQIRIDLSPTNIAVTNSTGNAMVKLYSGQTLVAQQEFAYYRSGNSLYPSDPGAINAWVTQYEGEFDTADVSNVSNDITYSPTTTAQTTATLSAQTVYEGTGTSSGYTSFPINGGQCQMTMRGIRVNPELCKTPCCR